jgi:hypothetical protein
MNTFRRLRATIADINRRYQTPRIAISPAMRLSLMALRIYLVILVGLMVYRFVVLVS